MKTKLVILLLLTASLVTTQAQFTKLHDFGGPSDGYWPYGSLISDGTFLYGTTYAEGVAYGTVFKVMPDGSNYTRILTFDIFTTGGLPCGALLYDGAFLYGTAKQGGVNGSGVIFKLATDGTGFTVLYSFPSNTLSGTTPLGDLITDGTYLYGTASAGGASNLGLIFKIKPDGSQYTIIHEFLTSGVGWSPGYGALFFDGTFLYGTTTDAGTGGQGTIYKVKTDGTEFTTLLVFSGSNGRYPSGGLTSDGTWLYGLTSSGGSFNNGVAFRIKPDGTGFTRIVNFISATKGNSPVGTLVSHGIWLYGTTYLGGLNDKGIMYRVGPDGSSFTRLFDFDGAVNGEHNVACSLFSDGIRLYGMTTNGGTYSKGVLFSYDESTGIANLHPENKIRISPDPFEKEMRISGTSEKGEITIYNAMGKEILHQNISSEETTINTSNLAAGFYMLKYWDGTRSVNIKVIKN